MATESMHERITRLSERTRDLEKSIYSHLSACEIRAKNITELQQDMEKMKELAARLNGGWYALGLVFSVIMNAIILVVTLFRG